MGHSDPNDLSHLLSSLSGDLFNVKKISSLVTLYATFSHAIRLSSDGQVDGRRHRIADHRSTVARKKSPTTRTSRRVKLARQFYRSSDLEISQCTSDVSRPSGRVTSHSGSSGGPVVRRLRWSGFEFISKDKHIVGCLDAQTHPISRNTNNGYDDRGPWTRLSASPSRPTATRRCWRPLRKPGQAPMWYRAAN